MIGLEASRAKRRSISHTSCRRFSALGSDDCRSISASTSLSQKPVYELDPENETVG